MDKFDPMFSLVRLRTLPPYFFLTVVALTFGAYRFTNTDAFQLLDLIRGLGTLPTQGRILIYFLVGRPLLSAGIADIDQIKLALCFMDGLFFFLSVVVFKDILKMLKLSGGAQSLGGLAMVIALYANYVLPRHLNVFYAYDLASVFATTLAVKLALGRSRWLWLLLPIATANRESALFLAVLPVLIHRDRNSLIETLVGIFLAASVYLAIRFSFNGQEGVQASFVDDEGNLRLLRNLSLFLSPKLFQMASFSGFLWLPALLGWRHIESIEIRRLWPFVLMILGINMIVGNLDELRVHSEITPIVVLWAVLALRRCFPAVMPSH